MNCVTGMMVSNRTNTNNSDETHKMIMLLLTNRHRTLEGGHSKFTSSSPAVFHSLGYIFQVGPILFLKINWKETRFLELNINQDDVTARYSLGIKWFLNSRAVQSK